MKKFITVVGARPQFVKAAAFSKTIKEEYSNEFDEKILHTGQHYDFSMSQSFFNELNIPAPYKNLNINSEKYPEPTGIMVNELYHEFQNEQPDFVLVYGDTNSTLAAAIAAGKLYIPVVHIEGGVRNADTKVPEHFNRVLTDHASELIFCVSNQDLKNLKNEGLGSKSFKTGDIMLDTVRIFRESSIPTENEVDYTNHALLTIHRNFNTDNPIVLGNILKNIGELNTKIIFPIHPRTMNAINNLNLKIPKNIEVCKPLTYIEILKVLKQCKYVLTDSGGLQKEAFYFGKKAAFVCHFDTFWDDLVSLDALKTLDPMNSFLPYESWLNEPMSLDSNPYGDGYTAKHTIDIIRNNI